MRRLARWGIGIAVTGAVLAGLGVAAIRSAPWLAERQADRLLREAGFPDAEVEVTRIGLSEAAASVRLGGSGQGVDAVLLGWSPDGIFDFELDRIELDGLRLTLARQADGTPVLAGRPLAGVAESDEPRSDGIPALLARLPVRKVLLRDAVLRLEGWSPFLPGPADIEVAAELDRAGAGTRVTARGGGDLGTFSLDLAGSERMEGVLRADPVAMAVPGAPGMTADLAPAELEVSVGPEGFTLATLHPVSAGFEGTAPGGVSVEKGALEASGTLHWEDAVAFFPEGCVLVSARSVVAGGIEAVRPKLCIGAPDDAPLLALPEEGGPVLAATIADGEASLPSAGPGVALRGIAGQVSFDFDSSEEGRLTAGLEVPVLTLGGTPAPLAPLSLQADIEVVPGGAATLSGRIGGAVSGRVSARHDLATGKGGLRAIADSLVLGGKGRPVAEVSPLLGRTVPDLHGTLRMKASLGWGPGSGPGLGPGRASILVRDAGLTAGGVALEGVNAVLEASSLFPIELPPGQEVAVAAMDAGVPLTSGLIRFGLAQPWRLTVQSASWDWAGGVVRAEPFALDLGALSGTPVLKAQGVDLGRLLALLPVEGLTGTGTLSGVLPLAVEGGRVSVADGRLAATGPGRLSYDPDEPPSFLTGGEQGTDLLLRAVTDFRYTSLEMTLDGTAGGELAAKLAISGSNPDFYDGYPVALTINLSGALDTVLRRSLDAYRIPDAVRDRMKEFESSGE